MTRREKIRYIKLKANIVELRDKAQIKANFTHHAEFSFYYGAVEALNCVLKEMEKFEEQKELV